MPYNPTQPHWRGVFPAVTTQFAPDLTVDHAATATMVDQLIREGIHGVIAMGTVGENNVLTAEEKRAVLKTLVAAVGGRIPVIVGVSELTTTAAEQWAREAQDLGADGLMVLPALVYVPTEAELETHLRRVCAASDLPVMLYNNPLAYRISIPLRLLQRLADVPNLIAVKESAEDTRRITDILNATGDRYQVFAGLDDMAFEGLVLGAVGWVSGLTNAFPRESVALYDLIQAGQYDAALAIYRWFLPLLHLDSRSTLVQCIKLAEQEMGRGSERVRLPRLPLSGAERDDVLALVRAARDSRPDLTSIRAA